MKLLLKQRIIAVYHDFHWFLAAATFLTVKLHSLNVKESDILERSESEKSESDILPPTPQPWCKLQQTTNGPVFDQRIEPGSCRWHHVGTCGSHDNVNGKPAWHWRLQLVRYSSCNVTHVRHSHLLCLSLQLGRMLLVHLHSLSINLRFKLRYGRVVVTWRFLTFLFTQKTELDQLLTAQRVGSHDFFPQIANLLF